MTLRVAKKRLPTTLTERRQISEMIYSDESYFKFVKYIPSIYVNNLTLEIMIAFDDGNLIEKINERIRGDTDVKSVFIESCSPNNAGEVNDLIYNFSY